MRVWPWVGVSQVGVEDEGLSVIAVCECERASRLVVGVPSASRVGEVGWVE